MRFFGSEIIRELLSMHKTLVESFILCNKLIMSTLFDLSTVPKNNDMVCFANGRQTVCNDNRGAIFGDPVQGILHYALTANVDGACCFIQY
jgi:hypothetical protein